jgi:hypothetical protein
MVERRPVEDKIKALNADIDVSIEEAKKRLKSSLRWHWLRPWQFAS